MNYIFCTNCGVRLSFPDAPCQRCPTISDFRFPETTQILAPEIETIIRPRKQPSVKLPTPAMSTQATRPAEKTNEGLYFLKLFVSVILAVGGIVFAVNGFGGTDGTVYVANTSIPNQPANNNSVSTGLPQNFERISQPPPKVQDVKSPQPLPKTETTPQIKIPPTPLPSQIFSLLAHNFNVPALNYRWFVFTFNREVLLTGEFSAKGGFDDIECIVLSDSEYFNFKDNSPYRSYYKSGYITDGKVNLRLPAGTYYIVFNNRAALLTRKEVKAKFDVE